MFLRAWVQDRPRPAESWVPRGNCEKFHPTVRGLIVLLICLYSLAKLKSDHNGKWKFIEFVSQPPFPQVSGCLVLMPNTQHPAIHRQRVNSPQGSKQTDWRGSAVLYAGRCASAIINHSEALEAWLSQGGRERCSDCISCGRIPRRAHWERKVWECHQDPN